jgi:hypothetical protein
MSFGGRTCAACGEHFVATRRQARFCSKTCRQREFHRAKRKGKPTTFSHEKRAEGQWERVILPEASKVVDLSKTTVTLRQVHYRLVAAGLIRNTRGDYNQLSRRTAEARRKGRFPRLLDRTSDIHRLKAFRSPQSGLEWLAKNHRLDRTSGQDVSLYIGAEKNTLLSLLTSWFGEVGAPIIPLGGYGSQSYVDDVMDDIDRQRRPAVLVYAGDFDPSGEDILRDFRERTNGRFQEIVRVALDNEQVLQYDLPPQVGKATDPRAAAFVARHGKLIQVEVEALPPETLKRPYDQAIEPFLNRAAYEMVLTAERVDRQALRDLAATSHLRECRFQAERDLDDRDDS